MTRLVKHETKMTYMQMMVWHTVVMKNICAKLPTAQKVAA
jgi:hypothetical protein